MDAEDKEVVAQLKRKIADRKEKLREQRFGRRKVEGANAAGLGGATVEEDRQTLQQREQEAKDEAETTAEAETRRTNGV